jgi:hypothetical protein
MNDTTNIRVEIVDGIKYKYSSDWIHQLEGEEHWRSYWHQLRIILPHLNVGDTILEIGPGSGFLSNYLRAKGFHVVTLDIDDQKSPDIVANIVQYPFPDPYDHVLAFEVFEHIPFEKFREMLPRLRKSIRKNLFMSVPLNHRIWFRADLLVPLFKQLSFSIRLRRRRIEAEHHFWELDYKQYSREKLLITLNEAGFERVSMERVKVLEFVQAS